MKYKGKYLSQYLDQNDIQGTLPILFEKFEEEYHGSKIIYLTETGSVLHGTNSDNSDLDIKGIYLPPVESFILQDDIGVLNLGKPKKPGQKVKNTADDIDLELYPINEFFRLLSQKMETNSVEILFSMFADKIIYQTDEVNLIRDNYKSFLKNHTEALTGFAISMADRYSVKGDRVTELDFVIRYIEDLNLSRKEIKELPISIMNIDEIVKDKKYVLKTVGKGRDDSEKEYLSVLGKKFIYTNKVEYVLRALKANRDRYGKRVEDNISDDGSKSIDLKAFSHAFRAVEQSRDLILKGFIQFPLPYADKLKKIKYGSGFDIDELSQKLDKAKDSLDDLKSCSVLPEEPDMEKIREIKLKMYGKGN